MMMFLSQAEASGYAIVRTVGANASLSTAKELATALVEREIQGYEVINLRNGNIAVVKRESVYYKTIQEIGFFRQSLEKYKNWFERNIEIFSRNSCYACDWRLRRIFKQKI